MDIKILDEIDNKKEFTYCKNSNNKFDLMYSRGYNKGVIWMFWDNGSNFSNTELLVGEINVIAKKHNIEIYTDITIMEYYYKSNNEENMINFKDELNSILIAKLFSN